MSRTRLWCNFSVPFSFFNFQYIHIKIIFKTASHFFQLLCSSWESVTPRNTVDSCFKRIIDSWRYTGNWKKKQTPFWSALIWAAPLKTYYTITYYTIRYYNAFKTWSSSSATHSNHLKNQGHNFTGPVAPVLPPKWYIITWTWNYQSIPQSYFMSKTIKLS